MNHAHRVIKANNMTYILDEDMATHLFQAMRAEFNWAGTVFCEEDVADTIANHREIDDLEPLSDEGMRSATAKVLESYGWRCRLTDHIIEQGMDTIGDLVEENVFHLVRDR
jgi:hypothetical protein